MILPIEMIEEIYSHLGNTDKRRLLQSHKNFKVKLQKNQFVNYYLEEYARDRYPIPQLYITFENIELFIVTDHLEMIKQIKMDKRQQRIFCHLSAKYGKLDLLKYAHEQGYDWDENTSSNAVEHGHLDCLKYLHEQGCPWDEGTCSDTALNGHLDCLQYAHEHGCPWDKWTCAYAARKGHLECLQYAIKYKCPGYEKYLDKV
jgi:hypothetical protein